MTISDSECSHQINKVIIATFARCAIILVDNLITEFDDQTGFDQCRFHSIFDGAFALKTIMLKRVLTIFLDNTNSLLGYQNAVNKRQTVFYRVIFFLGHYLASMVINSMPCFVIKSATLLASSKVPTTSNP